jgi:hypothetical protein
VPEVCQTYFKTASQSDRHNRCRQDNLGIEKSFEVKDWYCRVNTTLLSMRIIDAWLLHKRSPCPREPKSPSEFYVPLAEGLIENSYDTTLWRKRCFQSTTEPEQEVPTSGVDIHIMQTARKRRKAYGSTTLAAYQGRCSVCKGARNLKFRCDRMQDSAIR